MSTTNTVTNDIAIALALVDTVLKALPATAAFEPLVALLSEAVLKLAGNIGTDVTYTQLEGLRVKPLS